MRALVALASFFTIAAAPGPVPLPAVVTGANMENDALAERLWHWSEGRVRSYL